MTLERTHGKLRPGLPRASDLTEPPTAEKRPTGRDALGHFVKGNRSAVGARFTHAVRKSLGSKASSGEALVVANDARRVFAQVLRSLPSDAPPVRALLSVYSRHQSLHAFFTCKAEAVGLDTPKGLELLEQANKQSQRAERVLVTCFDLARICAGQQGRAGSREPWELPPHPVDVPSPATPVPLDHASLDEPDVDAPEVVEPVAGASGNGAATDVASGALLGGAP